MMTWSSASGGRFRAALRTSHRRAMVMHRAPRYDPPLDGRRRSAGAAFTRRTTSPSAALILGPAGPEAGTATARRGPVDLDPTCSARRGRGRGPAIASSRRQAGPRLDMDTLVGPPASHAHAQPATRPRITTTQRSAKLNDEPSASRSPAASGKRPPRRSPPYVIRAGMLRRGARSDGPSDYDRDELSTACTSPIDCTARSIPALQLLRMCKHFRQTTSSSTCLQRSPHRRATRRTTMGGIFITVSLSPGPNRLPSQIQRAMT